MQPIKKAARQAQGPRRVQIVVAKPVAKPKRKPVDKSIAIIAARLAALEETIPSARPMITWSGTR